MTSREKILSAISNVQTGDAHLPQVDINALVSYDNVFAQFQNANKNIGGKVLLLDDTTFLQEKIKAEKSHGTFVLNTVATLGEVDEYARALSASELERLDTVYLTGTLGVAENGAVWISESQMINRLLPFICQHLVLVIQAKDIVATMHHAYQRINVASEGFGVFIAGPSKTADIEQSLVIGAHGARSVTVYVILKAATEAASEH